MFGDAKTQAPAGTPLADANFGMAMQNGDVRSSRKLDGNGQNSLVLDDKTDYNGDTKPEKPVAGIEIERSSGSGSAGSNAVTRETSKLINVKATKVTHGHMSIPRMGEPDSIVDHVANDGRVDVRAFYNDNGVKYKEIHTTNHGNPKEHPFGKNGEHIHIYVWNEDGTLKEKYTYEIESDERSRNGDIF